MSEQKTRLTSNLPTEEMGMTELALNNCYVKDRKTMYRDYEAEYDVHDLIKKAAKALGEEIETEDSYELDFVLFDLKELEDAAEKEAAK